MHRRAILMTERPPKTALSRASTACEPPESEQRDKTGHIFDNTTQNARKTTASDEPQPQLSHSAGLDHCSGGASCGRSLGENNPSSLGAQTSPESVADSNDFGKVNQRSQAVPSPGGEGKGEGEPDSATR